MAKTQRPTHNPKPSDLASNQQKAPMDQKRALQKEVPNPMKTIWKIRLITFLSVGLYCLAAPNPNNYIWAMI